MQCNQVVKGKAIQKREYFRIKQGLDATLQDVACTGFSEGVQAQRQRRNSSPNKAKINLKEVNFETQYDKIFNYLLISEEIEVLS